MNMIHSMSGGMLREKRTFDFAKVKLKTGEVAFYISEISDLRQGDFVIVPFGKENLLCEAEVLRVDKNVSEQVAPVPIKRAKKIVAKVSSPKV